MTRIDTGEAILWEMRTRESWRLLPLRDAHTAALEHEVYGRILNVEEKSNAIEADGYVQRGEDWFHCDHGRTGMKLAYFRHLQSRLGG